MSTVVNCPNCQQKVKAAAELAGRQVKCPKCGNAFQVPGERKVELLPAVPAAPPPPVPMPPAPAPMPSPFHTQMPFAVVPSSPVLINTAPQLEPRLGSIGWFGRSFGTTMGVIMAILAIPAVITLVACGGCLMIAGGTSSVVNDTVKLAAQMDTARRVAAAELAKHDITELATDSNVIIDEQTATVVGTASRDGMSVHAQVWFDPKAVQKSNRFVVTSIIVDGRSITKRP